MPAYLSFRVELLGVRPPIWRTFLMEKSANFENLHNAIQDACGWQNCHLYKFMESKRGPAIAGIAEEFDEIEEPDPDATRVKVASYFTQPGLSCLYQYDFGDNWTHEVTLTEVVTVGDRFARRLLDGKRAFPPEDCGGIDGYEECVAIRIGKPVGIRGEELRERIEWIGVGNQRRLTSRLGSARSIGRADAAHATLPCRD